MGMFIELPELDDGWENYVKLPVTTAHTRT